jgi:hypothetical protein
MPDFRLTSYAGKIVKRDTVKGKYVYLQFVETYNENDIALLEEVHKSWQRSGLVIIGAVNNSADFFKKSKLSADDILFIQDDDNSIKRLFKCPNRMSIFYFYDEEGRQFATGLTDLGYQGHVRLLLNELIKNQHFSIKSFVDINSNIQEIPWLHQFYEHIQENPRKDGFIFAFFTDICDTCLSGDIIKRLNNFFDWNMERFGVFAILGPKYTRNDIYNVKQGLKVYYEVNCPPMFWPIRLPA